MAHRFDFHRPRPPAFAEPLHVGRPNIGNSAALHRRVQDILDRRWLSNDGPTVREFEREVTALVGVRHCIAVANATLGLEIVAHAAGLVGEVIVPANTFVATAHALEWLGLTPVFCDIDLSTHNLDPARVESLITTRTAAILGVHLWGRPCCPDSLQAVADGHGIPLLFDAAHAFGCSWRGQMIGNHGLAEVFSFHATKFVNCGEGGAIVTNDDALAARCRQMRGFGIAGCDHVVSLGTNGKLSELAAAMGLTSLECLPAFIEANHRNYQCYRQVLTEMPGMALLEYDATEHNNYQYVVLEIDEARSPLTRDQWLQLLHGENVLARRYFYPGVHRMEPYASREPMAGVTLPATEAVLRRVLVLPTGSTVSTEMIETIGGILHSATAHADRLSRRLPERLPLPTMPLKAA